MKHKNGGSLWKRKDGRLFLRIHLCLLLACLVFPLYLRLAGRIPSFFFECFLHDYLHLYCAFCGGTRAASALLHLQVGEALRYNALVVGLAVGALVWDGIAFIRLLKNKKPIFPYPRWGWIAVIGLLVAFFVLRNLLMILLGIDPTGDLGVLWQNWNITF